MEIKTSYAVIYWDLNHNKFLVTHPTHEKFWSLPKGGMEDSDAGSGAKAAAREMLEETNVIVDHKELIEAGRFEYYRKGRNGKKIDKDLVVYIYKTKTPTKPSEMICTSMVHHLAPGQEPFPENDGFKYIGIDEIDANFNPDGARVVKDALIMLGIMR